MPQGNVLDKIAHKLSASYYMMFLSEMKVRLVVIVWLQTQEML